jgi:hypothetical protein
MYNLIRIRDGDKWKRANETKYGYSESLGVLFKIASSAILLPHMINEIFKNMTDSGIITYINDIVIYS